MVELSTLKQDIADIRCQNIVNFSPDIVAIAAN